FFLFVIRLPPSSSLFPYTTLFRSVLCADLAVAPDDVFVGAQLGQAHGAAGVQLLGGDAHFAPQAELAPVGEAGGAVDVDRRAVRSEEHTSELQSRFDIVCRLLLEE